MVPARHPRRGEGAIVNDADLAVALQHLAGDVVGYAPSPKRRGELGPSPRPDRELSQAYLSGPLGQFRAVDRSFGVAGAFSPRPTRCPHADRACSRGPAILGRDPTGRAIPNAGHTYVRTDHRTTNTSC